MNDLNFSSRRNFVKKLCVGTSPLMLPFITSMKSQAIVPEPKENSNDALPDLERLKELFKQKNPVLWLFTGASITQGALHLHGYRSFPEIFAERIRYEMTRYRDFVVNTGISGATSAHILDDFDWRVARFRSHVVFLCDLGANDCMERSKTTPEVFERTVETLITKTREAGAIPILQTPSFLSPPEFSKIADFIVVVRSLAERKKVILIDHWAYWENTIQNRPEIEVCKNWLNDDIHPNGTGHAEMARFIFKELSIFDPKEPSCGGEFYEGEHCKY